MLYKKKHRLLAFTFLVSSLFCGLIASVFPVSGYSFGARVTENYTFSLTPTHIKELKTQGNTPLIHNFPISYSERGDIQLKKLRSAIDANTKVEVGAGKFIQAPEVLTFQGVVVGEPGSRVELTIWENQIIGSVQRAEGTIYLFGPDNSNISQQSGRGEIANPHIMTSQKALYQQHKSAPEGCRAEDNPQYYTVPEPFIPHEPMAVSNKLLLVDVAVDADYTFFKNNGSDVNKTIAYLANVFTLVSALYEDEVNVTMHVPYLKIWTSQAEDPYQVNGNPFDMVPKVENYWKEHHADIKRHAVHGITSTEWGGGGLGLLNTLCSEDAYACSAPAGRWNYPTFDYTYDVYIIAHEIGHIFGAEHTHQCLWNPAIDTCGTKDADDAAMHYGDACYGKPIVPKPNPGSIMSYCLQINSVSGVPFNNLIRMTFLPKVAGVIRKGAEKAQCVTSPADPTLVLRAPRGSENVQSGQKYMIKWSYANVENISLQYRTEGATTWTDIATNIPVTQDSLEWTIPTMTTSNFDVRVIDASIATVGDTSILPTHIARHSLALATDTYHIGPVVINTYLDTTVHMLTNDGDDQMNVKGITFAGPDASSFSLQSSDKFPVAPTQQAHVRIRFAPKTEGEKTAYLVVKSDVGDGTDSIKIVGSVKVLKKQLSYTDLVIDFGDGNEVGVPNSQNVDLIQNTGEGNVVVSETKITGPDATQFKIDEGGAPFTLASGLSRSLTVTYTPIEAGSDLAYITIKSDAGAKLDTITLKGGVPSQGVESVVRPTGITVLAYPNPFSSSVEFKLTIPERLIGEDATLAVYDNLGRQVATLFSGKVTSTQLVLPWSPATGAKNALTYGAYHLKGSIGSASVQKPILYLDSK